MKMISVTTRVSENPALSCNGGDYEEGYNIYRYQDGKITIKDWSSNELLEGTFEEQEITEEAAARLLYSEGYSVKRVYNFMRGDVNDRC